MMTWLDLGWLLAMVRLRDLRRRREGLERLRDSLDPFE
jgi:hypothetical protein